MVQSRRCQIYQKLIYKFGILRSELFHFDFLKSCEIQNPYVIDIFMFKTAFGPVKSSVSPEALAAPNPSSALRRDLKWILHWQEQQSRSLQIKRIVDKLIKFAVSAISQNFATFSPPGFEVFRSRDEFGSNSWSNCGGGWLRYFRRILLIEIIHKSTIFPDIDRKMSDWILLLYSAFDSLGSESSPGQGRQLGPAVALPNWPAFSTARPELGRHRCWPVFTSSFLKYFSHKPIQVLK